MTDRQRKLYTGCGTRNLHRKTQIAAQKITFRPQRNSQNELQINFATKIHKVFNILN